MKKLFALALLIGLCSCGNTQKIIDNNSNNNEDDEVSYYANDKYIVGKRIFDKNYYCDDVADSLPDKTMTFEEIPNVTFYSNGYESRFDTINGETIYCRLSLYIADVNQDGFFDVCYGESFGSGLISDAAFVYDIHNDEQILEKHERGKSDYYFDLDDNNVLCLVETKNSNGSGKMMKSVSRFLKDSRESMLEPFSYDFKPTGIFGISSFKAESSIEKELSCSIFFYKYYEKEIPLTTKDIIIEKVEGPDFTYDIVDLDKTYCKFTLKIKFSRPGNSKIKARVGNIVRSGEVTVS